MSGSKLGAAALDASEAKGNQSRARPTLDVDKVTSNLQRLCKLTPEGYMIQIEQRLFEARENIAALQGSVPKPNQTMEVGRPANPDSTYGSGMTSVNMSRVGAFSKDVENIFSKICQSIELYRTDNIPIITEFLEF